MNARRSFALLFFSLILFPYNGHAADNAPFTVGFSIALSGPVAQYGTAIKNGSQLFLKEHPEVASKLRFIFEDDKYDPKTTISVFNRLHALDKIDLLFVFGIAPSEAISPIAERVKFPIVVNSINPHAALGKRYVFRFVNHSGQYTKPLADYFKNHKIKRIAAIKTSSSYCDDLLRTLSASVSSNRGVVDKIASYGFEDSDFKSSIARIRKGKYEAVYACLFPGQVSTFFRQKVALGLDVPVFGTDCFESKTEIADSAGAMEGVIYPFNVVSQDFISRYRAEFGNDNQIATAANGYDFAKLLATRLSQLRHAAPSSAILDAIVSTPPFSGAVGDITYEEDNHGGRFFSFPVKLKIIRKGNFELLE